MVKLEIGKNDLQTYCIKNNLEYLLNEWHPTKNGILKPIDVTYNSKKKIWWLFSYDDPITKKHFDFEWEALIYSRIDGNGCPYISGHKIWKGFNDLETTYPELAKEWHPTKNSDLKPTDVSAGCNKKVWWILSYDDSITGKHFDFEWQARISNRAINKTDCPYLSGRVAWKGFNDLTTTHPELTKEWHPTKNGDLKPTDVSAGCNKKVWWLLSYDEPNTGKHFDFEWEATINSRALNGNNCPYLSGKAVWIGFNDLKTYCINNNKQYLLNEWDYQKNKNMSPETITIHSEKKANWICEFGHHYNTSICNRINGHNCSICAKGQQTSFPEQAILFYLKKYYYDIMNGNREILDGKELDIYIPSKNIAIEYDGYKWHQSEDDYKKDIQKNLLCKKHNILLYRIREIGCYPMEGNEFLTIIYNEYNNNNTLNLAIKKLLDLLGIYENIDVDKDKIQILEQYSVARKNKSLYENNYELSLEWHPIKNGNITPKSVNCGSEKIYWWLGKCGHTWEASVANRNKGKGCPFCANKKVLLGFNDLATTHPELAKEWHPIKNGNLQPINIVAGSNKKVWWILPYDDPKTNKHFDFEWEAQINSRALNGNSCPYLSGKAIWVGFNDLATTHPELVKKWHPIKNGNLTPFDVSAGSHKKVWWIDNNTEYQLSIRDMVKRYKKLL